MLTHRQIWDAIDALAARKGLSPSGLARLAGLDPTAFNKSKRLAADGRPRWPSTESIAKILLATEAGWNEFFSGESTGASAPASGCGLPAADFETATRDDHFDSRGLPKGEHWHEMALSPDAGSYVLEIRTDRECPPYRGGERIVLSPRAKTRADDRVLVKTRSGDIVIGRLARLSEDRVVLATLADPSEERDIATSDVAFVHRIIWASQ